MNIWSRVQRGRLAGYFQVGYKVHPCLQCSPVDWQDSSAVNALVSLDLILRFLAPLMYCRVSNSSTLLQRLGTSELGIASLCIALLLFDLPLYTQEDSHSINKGEEIIDSLGRLNLALSGHFHFPLILVVRGCTRSLRVSELEQVTRALGKGQHHH